MEFDVKGYWEERYKSGRDSGAGSYGRLARYKADFLNDFVNQNNVSSVLEIGCGDGNQLNLFKFPNYTGTDISDDIIQKDIIKSGEEPNISFLYFDDFKDANNLYELTISLDVIYHLSDDNSFEEYMNLLFTRSSKYVIIYSCDRTDYPLAVNPDAGYLRFRKFSDYIKKSFPDWTLVHIEPNPYPYSSALPNESSFANFYIYEKDSDKEPFDYDITTAEMLNRLERYHQVTNDALYLVEKNARLQRNENKSKLEAQIKNVEENLISRIRKIDEQIDFVENNLVAQITTLNGLLNDFNTQVNKNQLNGVSLNQKEENNTLDYVSSAVKKIYRNQFTIIDSISQEKIWERKYKQLQDSRRYRLGSAIADILLSPKLLITYSKKGLKILSNIVQIKLKSKKKKSAKIIQEISFNNKIRRKNYFADQLRAAVIVDEYTAEAFKNTTDTIFLTPDGWKKEINGFHPDFLFVESCWRGNNDIWGRLTVQANGEKKLQPLLSYCKKNNIPTVFWNKEDPLHYYVHNQNKFGKIAALFDFVFTSDANLFQEYKKDFNIDVDVLPFFCVPKIHHNRPEIMRKQAAVFAGSYYADKVERCQDFEMLISAVQESGLNYDIYDRNLDKNIANLEYPEKYRTHIIGKLNPDEVYKAHNGYKYQININTIKHSPTMFARRVYESLASGTPVITNYSKGVDLLFGDIVIMGKTKQELIQKIKYYESNPQEYDYIRQEGIKRCSNIHSFTERLEKIATLINAPVIPNRKTDLNILLYADVDLNYIDGSSIWLLSIAQMLSDQANVKTKILLKSQSKKSKLLDSIVALKQVELIYPKDLDYTKRFDDKTSVEALQQLITPEIDYVIVRGYSICKNMTSEPKFKGRIVSYILEEIASNDITKEDYEWMQKIYAHSAFMIVQSQNMLEKYIQVFGFDRERIILLPPMVTKPDSKPEFVNKNNSIVYTGKFSKDWYSKELLDLLDEIKKNYPTINMNIAGSIFRTDLPNREEIKHRFVTDRHINYLGGISREESLALVEESDIGFALRSEKIDNDESNEISTKILEYISYGKPVLLRKTKPHVDLLGDDYYLYADSVGEAAKKCIEILKNKTLYEREAKKCYQCFLNYHDHHIHEKSLKKLKQEKRYKKTLLFAGHDFKFLQKMIDAFIYEGEYRVLIDPWDGHDQHDEGRSKQLLEKADIIFCEWGLGNAVWYSKNKKPCQKLIVRMHLQERETTFPLEFNVEAIDQFIFISPYIKNVFQSLYSFPDDKVRMIYNYVDTDAFDLPKQSGFEYNIGMVGIVPQRKRFDLALDLIEKLYKVDSRYKLYIRGKRPEEYAWMKNRPAEMKYYSDLYKRIDSGNLKDIVIFDRHGDDMNEWFRKIGFTLSVSDFESFHLAPSEGMASGSSPAILHWEGAETIHPQKYIEKTVDDLCTMILNLPAYDEFNKKYVYQKFDISKIYREIKNLLSD